MKKSWFQRWLHKDIPFHQQVVNPLLEQYWPQLQIPDGSSVLVPLCGKTMDLLWLADRGYQVIGVELSKIPCKQFFKENNLSFSKKKEGKFTIYFNNAENIKIYCGDFFNLTPHTLPSINAIYDRAALIALPYPQRVQYVIRLTQFMSKKCQILLIVYQSPDIVQGPPYPVSLDEIQKLFGEKYEISELSRQRIGELPKHMREKGYVEMDEVVYKIKQFGNSSSTPG